MNTKPGRKSAGKAKKSSYAIKVGEVKMNVRPPQVQKDFQPASLTRSHPPSAPALWEEFETTARRLRVLFKSDPEILESGRLNTVVVICIEMLRQTSRAGDEKANGAIESLLFYTQLGCSSLLEAYTDKKSRDALKAVASGKPYWPMMLSGKDSFSKSANKILRQIGVGKITGHDYWADRVWMLKRKIELFRTSLKKQARHETSTSPIQQKFDETEIAEANKWKQVLDLQPELNKQTCKEWWAVAIEILKADWKANPDQKEADFKLVKKAAESEEKVEAMAVTYARKAFKAMAARASNSDD